MGIGDGDAAESNFSDLVALIKNLLDEDRLSEQSERIRLLNQVDFLAESPEERAIALALYFEVGRRVGDDDLLYEGMARLSLDQSFEFMRAFLSNLSNIAFLGDRTERWIHLGRFLTQTVPDRNDPALRFIDEGDPANLKELISQGWEPAGEISPSLAVEIRIQVAWRALDISRGFPLSSRVASLIESDFFRPATRAQRRLWEVAAIKAIAYLMSGDPQLAILTLQRTPHRPAWGSKYLCREALRFSPFAIDARQKWVDAVGCPGRISPATIEDSIVFRALELLESPEKFGPQRIHELTSRQDFPGWLVPLILCETGLKDAAVDQLLSWLSALSSEDLRNLPWKQCNRTLGPRLTLMAMNRASHRSTIIHCLLAMYHQVRDQETRKDLVRAIETIRPEDQSRTLAGWSDLLDSSVLACLPERVAIMLRRGGTYRAVVDGSNVMFGGLDRGAGARPNLHRLIAALADLKKHGFIIRTYFDESTKFSLPEAEQARLERMLIDGEVIQVRYADPFLIDEYLQDPEFSEIVSNDGFKNLRTEPEHLERATRLQTLGLRRRRISADGSSIVFEPPLASKTPLRTGEEVWKAERRP
jgi:hypothetical protein